ncbi:PDDEXK-like family protein [Sporosarcina sp. CAU 1771]
MSNKQQILSLIEDTQEFTLLDNHFNRFNPLKVLNVDNYEIRHSNVLAWLLNPKGNHGLGSYLANKILAKTFVNPVNLEEDKLGNYDILKLSRNNYQDLIVHKEHLTRSGRRIDLLAVSHIHKVVILIENKYFSTESAGQLEDYIEHVRSEYEGFKVLPIYLTLLDEAPSHEDYLMLGYSDILEVLENLIEANEQAMNSEVHKFLFYYTENLKDQLLRNTELNEIGLALYQNHKIAIDELVFASTSDADPIVKDIYNDFKGTIDFIKQVGDSILEEAFTRFAKQLRWPERLYKPHFRLPNFITQKWFDHFEATDMRENWFMNKGLIVWFEVVNTKLSIKLEIGPLKQEKRVKLLQAIKNRGIDIRDLAFDEGRKYTRIYMDTDTPSKWESVDSIVKSMNTLYSKEAFQTLLQIIDEAIEDKGEVEVAQPKIVNRPNEQAFNRFTTSKMMDPNLFYSHKTLPNFVLPEWTTLPKSFEVTENYWLGHPFIAWFSKRNSTIRLIVEVGPIAHNERVLLLKQLEAKGVPVRALAYEEGRKFTRIYSRAVPIGNSEDFIEIEQAMNELYACREFQEVREQISQAINELIEA